MPSYSIRESIPPPAAQAISLRVRSGTSLRESASSTSIQTASLFSSRSLRAVPESYYEGSLALGATHERSVFSAVFPAARSGILAGIILGVGRAIGETMAVVMIAGNQPILPKSLLSGVRTLTANIVLEMGYATDLHREALIACGVVLFVFILLINLCFSAVKRKADAT